MTLKQVVTCALLLCAFSAIGHSDAFEDLPSGRATSSACAVACGNRQATCSNMCGVAWSSQRMPDTEYRACMDHCVAEYISCSAACRKGV
jgi:hypothetical protein